MREIRKPRDSAPRGPWDRFVLRTPTGFAVYFGGPVTRTELGGLRVNPPTQVGDAAASECEGSDLTWLQNALRTDA